MKISPLVLILIASAVIRFSIASLPLEIAMTKFLIDDAFYGYKMAEGIANGEGFSNGFGQTNGSQPLWVLILSFFSLFRSDAEFITRLALLLQAFLGTVNVVAVFLLGRLINKKIAVAAAAIYGINPMISIIDMNGMETSITVLVMSMCAYFYFRNFMKKNLRFPAMLGVILGLSMLSRLDGIFLLVTLALHHALTSGKTLREKVKEIAVFSLIAAIIISSWLFWNYVNFGKLEGSGGVAKYLISHGIYKSWISIEQQIYTGLNSLVKLISFIPHYFGAFDFSVYSVIVAATISFLIIAGFFLTKKIKIMILFAAMLLSFFSFYFLSSGLRYVSPTIPYFTIFVGSAIILISDKIRIKAVYFIILLILISAIGGLHVLQNGYAPWQAVLLDGMSWIKENTTERDTIASFNSGIYNYMSGRRILNLDGVVNWEAIEAAKNRNVTSYMLSRNISYWVDMEFLNSSVYDAHINGKKIEILDEVRWSDIINEKDRLKLLEERYYTFKSVSGKNVTIVWFIYKVVGNES